MDINNSDRQFLSAMRALALDGHGDEVFVGLTVEESVEFNDLSRRDDSGGEMSPAEKERFLALRAKHEEVRQRIVQGEEPLHP